MNLWLLIKYILDKTNKIMSLDLIKATNYLLWPKCQHNIIKFIKEKQYWIFFSALCHQSHRQTIIKKILLRTQDLQKKIKKKHQKITTKKLTC